MANGNKKYARRVPSGLTGPGAELWKKLMSQFEVEDHEAALVEQYCKLYSRVAELDNLCDEKGLLLPSPQGERVNPCLIEARQARLAMGRLAATLKFPGVDE